MIPTTTILGAAERDSVASIAAEIEEARRASAPQRAADESAHGALADRVLDGDALASATRAITDVLRRRGVLSEAEAAALDARTDLAHDVPTLLEWASGRRAETPFHGAPVAWGVMRLALPAFVGSAVPREDVAGDDGCPECGMAPDLALILPNGARRLICGVCDTEWRFDRVRCPFCRNAWQDRLAYLVGDTAGLLIRVCDACRTYLKTVDRRALRGDETPLLLRLLLVEMDATATRAGYHPAP